MGSKREFFGKISRRTFVAWGSHQRWNKFDRLRLTFSAGVAEYHHEGAHSFYRLVHPFRPVLARGVTRAGSAADHLAGVPATPPDRHYRERRLCSNSGVIVPSRTLARWEESVKLNGRLPRGCWILQMF